MIHEFDFVTWLLGNPKEITALGVEGKARESHVSSLLNYNDAVVLSKKEQVKLKKVALFRLLFLKS